MNVFITGGCGFIGSHLAERLLSQGDAVFWPLALHVLKDKFNRGVARVECVELWHQYLHLSPLVGKS